ncbi:MAG: hypothetical protein GY854_03295 [Deltaproteobacteria bacterium]|nr:hypothetical protein [Deltaproteobacteria bacterium]
MNSLSKLILFACAMSLALAPACGDDDDSVGAGDSDGDSDGDSERENLTTAYFIGETLTVGRANLQDGCDVDGDGTADNAIAVMLNSIPKNLLPSDPNQTIADKIASGESLSVFALIGVDSFEEDNSILLKAYQGLIDDPDAGVVPDDQFSGHGNINIEEPPNSTIENASISGGVLTTPVDTFSAVVPLGDTLVDVELDKATVEFMFDPPPGDDMLNGKARNGKICGAINAQELIALAKQSPDVPALIKPIIGTFINPAADMTCNDKPCLSVGLKFTSVSVAVND